MMTIEQIWEYEKRVAELNCKHADEHGVCELLSTNDTKEFCPLSICKQFKEREE